MQQLIVAVYIAIKITTYLNIEKPFALIKNIFLSFTKKQLSSFASPRNFKIKIQNKALNNIPLQIKYSSSKIFPRLKMRKITFPFALVTGLKRILQKYFLNNIFLSTLCNPLTLKTCAYSLHYNTSAADRSYQKMAPLVQSLPSPNSPMGLCLPQDGPQHGSARIVGGLGIVWTRESKGLGIEKGQAKSWPATM